ncbi:MAG: hypothetical protein SOZ60_09105 [Prevotella sp.]|nr:hypothetical protein [Prevotella sp.]
MKYIKLLMLLAVVTFFGACSSDDDSWNSAADVTVSMKNPTMVIKENMGLTNVPIEVKGKTNGNVYVTLAVKEVGSNPAKEDVHYYITDKTISISDSIGYVEVEPVDDDGINADRTFEITIVEAKGAEIGNATTQVSLKDNDSQIYEKLQGKWKLTGVSRQGAPMESVVKIIGASDEEDGDYNNTLYLTGMAVNSSSARLSFHYDEKTKQGYVAFDNLGKYNFIEGYDFTKDLGIMGNIVLSNLSNGSLTTTPIKGTWSEDCKEIVFDQDQVLFGGIYTTGGTFTGYEFFSVTKIKLTKVK